jgi:predicted alpha/beta-fold hydrolase
MQPGNTKSRSKAVVLTVADRAAAGRPASEVPRPHDFFGESFRPRRPFTNGHAQTLVGNFLPRRNQMPPPEERLFHVESNVQVLCHCHWQQERARATTLIIVHGLEGSSESGYVIGTGNKAWSAGMNVVRMNVRSCGSTEHLGPTLYNSGMSGDVSKVAQSLIQRDGLQRLALAGFSMGGNMVLKLLGEWGDEVPLQVVAAAAISPAIDLAPSADALHDPANRVYEIKFLWSLRQRIQRKAALFPGQFDLRRLRGVRSLRDFDNQITAPHFGFLDAQDYYTRAASTHVLDRIAVPTLVLHAEDDPFIRVLPDTREKLLRNPRITFLESSHGGHCAFLAEANGYDGRWAERQAVAFIQRIERGEPVDVSVP